MQFVVTHVPMYNVDIICLTIPINSPAALHVNFNLSQAINYIKNWAILYNIIYISIKFLKFSIQSLVTGGYVTYIVFLFELCKTQIDI